MVQLLWKTVWWVLTKLNIFSPYDPAIVLLDIPLKELKTYVLTKACTQMFTAVVLIIAKTWKQPGCPSVGKYTVVYPGNEILLALKRNKLSNHEKTWRKPQVHITEWEKPS